MLNPGLLTSKKEEYVLAICVSLCVFFHKNNFGNTSFILAQVTQLLIAASVENKKKFCRAKNYFDRFCRTIHNFGKLQFAKIS